MKSMTGRMTLANHRTLNGRGDRWQEKMPAAPLTAEERQLISRAKLGGGASATRRPRAAALPPEPQPSYPAGCSTKTLGLLGKFDALLKAEPQPPKWALLKVLSMLEEARDREDQFGR